MLGVSFLASFLGFISGVALHSFFSIPVSVSLLFAVVSIAGMILVSFFKRRGKHELDTIFFFVFLFLVCFSAGLIRYDLSELKKDNPGLEAAVQQKSVVLEGEVSDDPYAVGASVSFTLRVLSVDGIAGRGLVKISNANFIPLQYGDKVKLSGLVEKPKNFTDDSGKEFDYVSYLAKDGIYYQMNRPHVELVSIGSFGIRRELYAVRKLFLGKINELFSAPHSALLAGLLIGDKQELGKDLTDEFRRAGIIHVVVLSGSNITIVANAIAAMLSELPRSLALSGSAIGIILFTLMTGATATVMRASIMALIAILGKYSGRSYDPLRALLVAAAIMLLGNPKLLIFDPSFQLSFLSTLGLILLTPYFEKWLAFLPEKYEIRAIGVVTCSTQAFVTPFLLYQVGQVSLVALIVNFLVLGFIPATMLVGFVAVALGFVASWLAYPAAFASYLLLSYELWITHVFASFPFAALQISFPFWLVAVCYAIIAAFLIRPHWRAKREEWRREKEKILAQESEEVSEIVSF